MNKHLEQLVKLSQFDRSIINFDPQIKKEKDKLKLFTQSVDNLIQQRDKLYSSIDDIKNKRIKNDIHLAELRDKLESIAGKHKLAKNEKEFKALQLEEEIAKEQVSFANDEIIRLDALIESKTTELENVNKELEEEEKSVEELRVAIDNNIKALEDERNKVFEEKSILTATIDPKVLAFYEKTKRWAKETTVVPVKKQACYGCHMKLSDRFYSEFVVSDEIMTCPHCGRIIYKDNSEEEV